MSVEGKGVKSQGRSAVEAYGGCDECEYCLKMTDFTAFCWYCKRNRKMCRDHLQEYLASAYGIVAGEKEGDNMFVMRPCRCPDCEEEIEGKRRADEEKARKQETKAVERLKTDVVTKEETDKRFATMEAKLDALIAGLVKGKDHTV